jgi:gluconolactonase
VLRIKSPAGILTSNCAFGGPEGRTLFITECETASILSVELPVRGFPMFAHA